MLRGLFDRPGAVGTACARLEGGFASHSVSTAGKWRVGAKRLYQLIPRGLKARLEKERKKRFEAHQREAVTAATAAVAAFQRKHNSGSLSAAEEKEAKDLKDRVQTLKDLEDKWEDLGA
jgi:hypothetical protein